MAIEQYLRASLAATAIVIPVTCFGLTACVTRIKDLSISGVTVDVQRTVPEIFVDFSTRSDLSQLRRYLVLVHTNSVFCDQSVEYAVLGWGVGVRDSIREAHSHWLSLAHAKANSSGLYIYTVAIPVSRKASPTSIPAEVGFDLQADL